MQCIITEKQSNQINAYGDVWFDAECTSYQLCMDGQFT